MDNKCYKLHNDHNKSANEVLFELADRIRNGKRMLHKLRKGDWVDFKEINGFTYGKIKCPYVKTYDKDGYVSIDKSKATVTVNCSGISIGLSVPVEDIIVMNPAHKYLPRDLIIDIDTGKTGRVRDYFRRPDIGFGYRLSSRDEFIIVPYQSACLIEPRDLDAPSTKNEPKESVSSKLSVQLDEKLIANAVTDILVKKLQSVGLKE